METEQIQKRYFQWLIDKIYDKKITKEKSYKRLLSILNDALFIYQIQMDENRKTDGIDLRYSRFGWENNLNSSIIDQCFDKDDCSVLEMLVALAIRCEENFMQDNDRGNRTAKWFWKMVENMGLMSYDDDNWDEDEVIFIIDRFLNREYEPDGRGGLFYIPDTGVDLRDVEIWCQLCWYLDGYLK